MIKTNEYLYGSDVEVPSLDAEVIMRRIELLSDHLSELLEQSYHTRDRTRVAAVLKAISFWQKMVKETL